MRLMIHEILEKVGELKTKKEKVEFLQKHNCLALRDILKGGFDDTVQFNLPDGVPPYVADDAPMGYNMSTLNNKTKKFRYFAKGGPGDKLPAARRERMFIEILESVHEKEAEVVIAMKEKKIDKVYKGVTMTVVKEAFPRLIFEPQK